MNLSQALKVFYLFNYLCAVLLLAFVSSGLALTDPRTGFFVGLIVVTYAAIYFLPSILLSFVLFKILKYLKSPVPVASPVSPSRSRTNIPLLLCFLVAGLTAAATLLLLVADNKLYELYGFHTNAFVLNLILTPGGIDSLDAGSAAERTLTLVVVLVFALEFALAFLALKLTKGQRHLRLPLGKFVAFLLFLSVVERFTYAVSDIQSHSGVILASQSFPFYSRLTLRTLASDLGYAVEHKERGVRLAVESAELRYPLKPIRQIMPERPLNMIWLVAESLRWDMLTPEIMPQTWQFARQSWHLTNHYSGGNGTRQGLFALFYGLYGSYWDSFLLAERGPVMFDVLKAQNYQMQFYTSAAFSYPEFDQTLFSQIDKNKLHQFDNSVSAVDRDRMNIDNILEFVQQRDRSRPFMTFLFLESTHARYSFPPSSAIREPYLENMNYAIMSRESLRSEIAELKNRYINASHYVDEQIGRLLEYLNNSGLMDTTLILITGDHGEEFMEQGHWGHNRGFSKQQISSPMVLWIPAQGQREVQAMTSHIDIIPTLLPLFGVKNPAAEYSLGVNLLQDQREPYVVVSDIAGLAYVGEEYTFSIPFKSSLENRNQLWSAGKLQENPVGFLSEHGADLNRILANSRIFSRSGSND